MHALRVACLVLAAVAFGCAPGRPSAASSPQPAAALESDLDLLTGAPWTGTLTYLDFSTGKSTTIRSTLAVVKLPRTADGPAWDVRTGYTDEPRADRGDTLVLSDGGRRLGAEAVVDRSEPAPGAVRIVTEERADDNNRPALLRREYTLSAASASIRKLVKIDGETEFFERNAYRWSR